MNRFKSLFPQPKPIIGMISLPPLPGYPAFHTIEALIDAALADLEALQRGGAHGVLIENDFDQPHTLSGGPEIIAAMTRVAHEVTARARVPVGIQVLLNDWRASLAIAAAANAQFVRLDFFVDRVQIKAGIIEPQPKAIIAYRKAIRAEQIVLLTDIQVKYSTLVDGPKSLEKSAREAAAAGADALVVTGAATGIGPQPEDLHAARVHDIPMIIGSGLTSTNAPALLPYADGAIVGTFLRSGPHPNDRIVESQVRALMASI
ncbi:MAG: BtpA/SgcQ family protein [Roseiflexaceae bacterium]|mgnify:CR=1 FL=1|nr:BtpA/SgcQ family protein [Roseiflexaceae bacterium]